MSLGYNLQESTINFEYDSPLYTEDSNLVFGLETKSSNSLIFKAKSERTSKTIVVEIVIIEYLKKQLEIENYFNIFFNIQFK